MKHALNDVLLTSFMRHDISVLLKDVISSANNTSIFLTLAALLYNL